MRILLSLALIAVPVIVYWAVIRPRLKARWSETYANIDGFWSRLWARVVAFRTWVIAGIALALPELIDIIAQLLSYFEPLQVADLTWLPDKVQWAIRSLALVALMVNQARKTTPDGMPEPGAEAK